ncbi:hypothetical protein [Corynebacterium stationis]|uniref:hypothetical protein n=1 Tax=Corynebacterium stationis TaxID=1705 RepID=UPI000B1E2D00|nr:hypothetical protein [Corynebacterium stationis]HJG64022.1 hypothetical protein [Corynebacterium stationis]
MEIDEMFESEEAFDTRTMGVDLKRPGHAVYKALVQAGMDMADISLCEEAGRMRDRLDQLQLIISGDESTWAELADSNGGTLVIRIDDAVKEARQMTTVYRQLVGDIKRRWPEAYAGSDYDGLEDLDGGTS